MKTTVEIPDALFAEAKRVAAEEGTTLRELVEAGLREVVQRRRRPRPFRLRDAGLDGRGLRPEFAGGDWARLRDAAYEGRGG